MTDVKNSKLRAYKIFADGEYVGIVYASKIESKKYLTKRLQETKPRGKSHRKIIEARKITLRFAGA